MDIKTISVAFVAIMVGAVAFGAMLPIFQDVTATEDTYTNTGLWRMGELTPGDTWARNSSNTWTYNGETVLTSENSASSVLVGDTWSIRGNGIVWASTYYANNPDVSITVGDSNVTINVKTISGIDGYGAKSDGDYIMTQYNVPSYVHGDSRIYASGTSLIDTYGFVCHIEGTINDGVTINCYAVNNTTTLSNFVVSNVSINATKDTSHVDLYRLDSITFDVSADYTSGGETTPVSGPVSYSSYVVPYQVTAERVAQGGDGFNTIVNLIPLVIGMGLLLIAVWWFVVRKF